MNFLEKLSHQSAINVYMVCDKYHLCLKFVNSFFATVSAQPRQTHVADIAST